MREPAFWWRPGGAAATALTPVATLYGAIARRRMSLPGARADRPVICIGNFTLGGSGKTPAAIAVAHLLTEAGLKVVLLSRGYGGKVTGPLQVDPLRHTAVEVGDEALLLAHAAPTIVARDRVAGARAATMLGADAIVLDDGLQNASLAKDFSLAVVDGRRGAGNGKAFPAGPLRAPLDAQWPHIDAVMVVGEVTAASTLIEQAQSMSRPVFYGRLEPDSAVAATLRGHNVLAFAGIGDPEKFFATLAAAGIRAPVRKAFPDHHRYSNEEAAALMMDAEHRNLDLLTTEKDIARMTGEPGLAALRTRARALPVTLKIAATNELRDLLLAKIR